MKIVLHICCGVCAAGAAERLKEEGYDVHGFYYNPNIYPAEEYQRRLEVAEIVARELAFPLESVPYQPDEWMEATRFYADEPEGGRRCEVCFRFRLKETYRYMNQIGADMFTSTLTISPHKSPDLINTIGYEIGGDTFLARDFKKKDGFRRTMELAKKWQLYRQNYCGCIYSMPKE